MRRHDRKLDGLSLLGVPDRDLVPLGRIVELVEARAGAVVAVAGVAGRWRTLVLSGSVATTCPSRAYGCGDVVRHGPETALVALSDCRVATLPERDAAHLDGLLPARPVAALPVLDLEELAR